MSDWEALSKGTGLGTERCEAPYEYDIDDGSYIACGEFAVLCFLPGGYRGRWGEWPEDVSFICDEHNEDDRRFPGYYYIKYGAYCTECECPCEKEGEISKHKSFFLETDVRVEYDNYFIDSGGWAFAEIDGKYDTLLTHARKLLPF